MAPRLHLNRLRKESANIGRTYANYRPRFGCFSNKRPGRISGIFERSATWANLAMSLIRCPVSDKARQIVVVEAKNQATRQPRLNLQIAKAYLAGADQGINKRCFRWEW